MRKGEGRGGQLGGLMGEGGGQLGDGRASRLHGEVNLLLGFSIYIVCNMHIYIERSNISFIIFSVHK